MIIDITDDTFDLIIPKYHIAVLDFYATWCSPCMQIMKILPRLDDQLVGNNYIVIGKVDVDKNPKLKKRFNIKKVPSFGFFVDGEERLLIEGVITLAIIKKHIDDLYMENGYDCKKENNKNKEN